MFYIVAVFFFPPQFILHAFGRDCTLKKIADTLGVEAVVI